MIKILKQGNHPKDAVYELVCPFCVTIFEFTPDEADESVQTDEMHGREYSKKFILTVSCPTCNTKLKKDKNDVKRYLAPGPVDPDPKPGY